MFTTAERIEMIENDCKDLAVKYGANFCTVSFNSLVIAAAHEHNASLIFRGLRDSTDFDYEMRMVGMNANMAPYIETVFLASSPEYRYIASNLVRQIANMGGDVSCFVSANVAMKLKNKVL